MPVSASFSTFVWLAQSSPSLPGLCHALRSFLFAALCFCCLWTPLLAISTPQRDPTSLHADPAPERCWDQNLPALLSASAPRSRSLSLRRPLAKLGGPRASQIAPSCTRHHLCLLCCVAAPPPPTPLCVDPAPERYWESPDTPEPPIMLLHVLDTTSASSAASPPSAHPAIHHLAAPPTPPPPCADPAPEQRWEAPSLPALLISVHAITSASFSASPLSVHPTAHRLGQLW
ncbi:hypothetical protein M422DRAFT_274847 [Sphaerobolus stellatus SS14]|uniref:Uncharacterized protein n=1 Tax=Sphaerobolus stellatus (strain SS14) TaxID=990650 RepID=A0A0C9UG15_SPHS4|nr:hypothetical protein M422DRAFT_274847 [Sphaerobolus stellatus SS14]